MKKFRFAVIVFLCISFFSFKVKAEKWTLEQCLEYARDNNKELLAKNEGLHRADKDIKSAWARLVPEIEGSASIDHYWQIPVQVLPGELLGQPGTFIPVRMGTPWMGNVGIEGRLRLLDATVWQDIRLARLQEQVSDHEHQSLERTLLKNVRMAFYNVQQQYVNVSEARQLHDNYADIHRLLQLQFEQGLTDQISMNQSLSLLKDREDILSRAETDLKSAYLDLKFWMGFPLQDKLTVSSQRELERFEAEEYDASRLPEYQMRQFNVALLRQRHRAAFSHLYPSLHLTSSVRRLGFGDGMNFITDSKWFTSGFVGVQLRVPIFSMSNMFYQTSIQKSFWRQAELEFSAYQEQQKQQYLKEELRLREAWQSVERQRDKVELARENEQLAIRKIESGIIDMIQLRQIQQDLSQARERLNQAELSYLQHYVELNYLQNQ